MDWFTRLCILVIVAIGWLRCGWIAGAGQIAVELNDGVPALQSDNLFGQRSFFSGVRT